MIYSSLEIENDTVTYGQRDRDRTSQKYRGIGEDNVSEIDIEITSGKERYAYLS